MDYEREDRIATRRAEAAIESERREAAGEYPLTILEASHALGLDSPVSHDDLVTFARVAKNWNVKTNVEEMLSRLLAQEGDEQS